MDKDIQAAISLLKDDNLVWSADFEQVRKNLAGLLVKATQVEYHHLEPEITELALHLIRERENNAGEFGTTQENNTL